LITPPRINSGDIIHNLSQTQLIDLVTRVFGSRPDERGLAILVDLPDKNVPDNPSWRDRREIAGEWFKMLCAGRSVLPFPTISFCVYPNAGSNNNDLPPMCTLAGNAEEFARLPEGRSAVLTDLLKSVSVVIAPTELSATAPLKVLAKTMAFRGATLPGFSRAMMPALMLDYESVNARVLQLKERMDRAEGLSVSLAADGVRHDSFYDLRYRTGHASGGLMREPGTVGNLPSGEAYIVPYEGERVGEESRTAGLLPVQFGDEIVVYVIDRNSAVSVKSSGPVSDAERAKLASEPAYGNIAEIGMGVLGEWGVEAAGSVLLDEKLGLHIAFGRSEHFGGITGPSSFRDPQKVIHIDRVYVPSTQPRVQVVEATFHYGAGEMETVMRNGGYVV
jgi:hypothetical protein